MCELEDGTFVSGGFSGTMKRWDVNGRVLQTFSGRPLHPRDAVLLSLFVVMDMNSPFSSWTHPVTKVQTNKGGLISMALLSTICCADDRKV